MATTIQITVDHQKLTAQSSPVIASRGVEDTEVAFTFDSSWSGYTKTAVFYREDTKLLQKATVSNSGVAVVPWEIMAADGRIFIGVSGTNEDVVYTTDLLPYRVRKGIAASDVTVEPEEWEGQEATIDQIVTAYLENHSDENIADWMDTNGAGVVEDYLDENGVPVYYDNVKNAPPPNSGTRMESIGVAFLSENKGIKIDVDGSGQATNSSVLDAMNIFVKVPDGVRSIYCKCPTYEADTTFGIAFSSTTGYSGYKCGYRWNNTGEYGTEWRTFIVPDNARYFRMCWFHDTDTYGEWEGFYCYDEVPRLADEVEDIDEVLLEDLVPVEITEITDCMVTTSSVNWSASAEGYTTYTFLMEPGAKYIIVGHDNQLIRFGAYIWDWESIYDWQTAQSASAFNTAADSRAEVYGHSLEVTDPWSQWAYFMGKTPDFPDATFEVYKVPATENKLETKVELSDGDIELVDKGAVYFRGSPDWNAYVRNGDEFATKLNYSTMPSAVLFNLSDMDANTSSGGGNQGTVDNKPAIATIGRNECIDVYVDVDLDSTTFTQFAISSRTPNGTTSLYNFFNIKAADITDGHFTFSKRFFFPEGTELGPLYLYWADAQTEYKYICEGTISIVKRKAVVDSLDVGGRTYYLDKLAQPFDETKGYVRSVGKLYKSGKYIVDENDVPVELRGVGIHAPLQYKHLHNRKAFECLRNMGVNMIRISVYLEDYKFLASDNEIAYGYISHPNENKAEIEKIIKICIDLGMYVLLDWHVFYDSNMIVGQTYSGTDRLHQAEALEFFEYFTSKFGEYPNMLYDLANEPYFATVEQIVPFVQAVRAVILDNVEDPIMTCGYGASQTGDTWYTRTKRLHDALSAANITDVFVAPHTYGINITTYAQQLWDEDIPFFCTEWGNSQSSGDGAGNDGNARANIAWFHKYAVANSVWKFTDQTMTTSWLKNQGIINSEKWLDGFECTDLSHNGALHLSSFNSFIHSEWIERTALT